jgi:hypothetical protein
MHQCLVAAFALAFARKKRIISRLAIGSARVRVRATGAAARPSMARAVKDPLLKDLPARVVAERTTSLT